MSSPRETWLVTGASGCIGAWTVLTLVKEGAEVVALDRGTASDRLRLIGGDGLKPARAVDVDIRDLGGLERFSQNTRLLMSFTSPRSRRRFARRTRPEAPRSTSRALRTCSRRPGATV